MIENLGRNSKKILKPLNTIEGIVFEFLEPLEGSGEWTLGSGWLWNFVTRDIKISLSLSIKWMTYKEIPVFSDLT